MAELIKCLREGHSWQAASLRKDVCTVCGTERTIKAGRHFYTYPPGFLSDQNRATEES